MSVLRNVWADMVEKKLWPVAVALLVALVAVPVVIASRSSGDTPAPAPAPNAAAASTLPAGITPAQAQAAQVSLDTTLSTRAHHRKGAVRNPFKELRKAVKAAATTATTTASATTPPSSASAPASGGGAAPQSTTPTPAATPPAATPPVTAPLKPNPLTLYRVSIRFGKAGALKTRKDIPRLTPLPSSTYPFFVYLGVLSDKQTAVFLISSDVKATGDGTCRPSRTSCQTIELKRGDTEFFDYSPTGDEADVTQFQMDLLSVHKHIAGSAAVARRARAARSTQGRAVVKAATSANLIPQINRYRYSKATGLLRRSTSRKTKIAAASRAPSAIVKKTPWGTIAKANGAVIFAARKARAAAHA